MPVPTVPLNLRKSLTSLGKKDELDIVRPMGALERSDFEMLEASIAEVLGFHCD